jgi:peptide/nickel transport system substrate-binding protein
VTWVLLLLVAFSAVGCTTNTSADPGAVTVAIEQAPTTFDPRVANDANAQRLIGLIFVSLVKKNHQSEIEPDLALRWELPDPQTYIFYLRNDAKFHDGRPITAKDVVFTFRSILDGSIKSVKIGTYRLVESVEAPDDYTVVFKLKEPLAPFILSLTREGIGIVPEGSGPDFGRNPIGSGPFEFVRYIQDQEVVLKRSETYYGKKANVSFLTFKYIPEGIVTALELRKGSVDIALNILTADMVEVFKRDGDVKVTQSEGTNYYYIAFNLRDSVFRDLRVRKAFAHAVNREQIIKYLWRDQARPATGVIPPASWAYEGNVATYPYDPERARELLKEAGYENVNFTFRTSNADEARLLATVLQHQFREIGVTMDIRSNEFATFFADVINGNFQMFSLRWIGGNNDPDHLDAVFSSKRTPPNGFNRGFYFNARVDELVEMGRRELDMEKRKQAYTEVQRIVAEELPYISLFYRDNVCAHTKRIHNVNVGPEASWDFLTEIRTD